ncbi:MAG: DMT family transporter [Clostridia bacterium]|nr:DMT family transporter [Clostridia bacterium]
MLASKKMNFIGQLLLFLATLVWGTSFIVLKETIEQVPSFYVIAIRFIIAGGILSLIFIKKLREGNRKTFLKGVILGVLLFSAYLTQTLGLENTTAGRNAFITGSYCVMCPFIVWVIYKKRPKIVNLVSAVLCIVGLALVSLSGDDGVGENLLLGDSLTLIGAFFFALQIVAIDKFQKDGENSVSLLCYELLTVGVLFAILTLIFDLPTGGIEVFSLTLDQMVRIGYLCLVCTLFAQFAQMFGQKYTTPNQTSIILTLEAVFGVVFAVILGGEKLTATLIIGFIVIFISVLISEVDVDYNKLFRKNKEK